MRGSLGLDGPRGEGFKKGSTSFLKKRSKKFSFALVGDFLDEGVSRLKVFWFFFSKKNVLLSQYQINASYHATDRMINLQRLAQHTPGQQGHDRRQQVHEQSQTGRGRRGVGPLRLALRLQNLMLAQETQQGQQRQP